MSLSHPSVSKINLGTPELILTSAPNHLFLFVIIFLFGVDLKHVCDQFQENNRTWTTGNWNHWQGKTEALGIGLFILMFHCWFWPGSLPDCCGYRSSCDRISYKFPITDKSILGAVTKCWQNLCNIPPGTVFTVRSLKNAARPVGTALWQYHIHIQTLRFCLLLTSHHSCQSWEADGDQGDRWGVEDDQDIPGWLVSRHEKTWTWESFIPRKL